MNFSLLTSGLYHLKPVIHMIKVQDLIFDYPGTRALNAISFTVAPQTITALVGPNGAGKTTLLRCLAALETPLSGSIEINGIDIYESPRACHRLIGYLSDFFGLYDDLTVEQCLLFAASSRNIPADFLQSAVERAAMRLKIADRLASKAGTLSRGLRQRLAIAQAIVHNPLILLLDEPASGLDPEARHSLADLFLSLRDDGITLVVSSHILSELDEYSTNMLVIKQGNIIANEPIGAETKRSDVKKLAIQITEPVDGLIETLNAIEGVSGARAEGLSISLCFAGDAQKQHLLLKELIARNIPLYSLSEERHNIQQAYLSTVKTNSTGAHAS